MTSSNQTCLVSDATNENLNIYFSNDDCQLTNDRMDLSQPEWYNEIDINSIGLVGFYEPLSVHNEVYNEVEVFDILDEATVQHDNFKPLFKLEDQYKFQMYDVPCTQIDGGAKCMVTNNINLLKNVRWYNQWF